MTIEDKIRDEILQYDINREVAKISAWSAWSASAPRKTDKFEYLTGEETLPSDEIRMKEQAKFTYSPLRNA